MKFQLITVNSANENWSDEARELYLKKINYHIDFNVVHLKPKKVSREQADLKRQQDSELILNYIKSEDFVVLFDENGVAFNSIDFSKKINFILGNGKKRTIFIIGGAFGVTQEVKKRANLTVSLSKLVMNHLVAELVILEQLYRSFMILKNAPYHNE